MIVMSEDAAAGFAAMMNDAAEAAGGAAVADAPPKRPPGRPRKQAPPSVDELKAAAEDAAGDGEAPPASDRAPVKPRRPHRRVHPEGEPKGRKAPPAPQFREGQIAGGLNRLYRKAGQIIKAFDPVVGAAFIEATRKDDPADVTVGEAWEELARGNPRIRAFLLPMITGGAWGQLVMAHAPILLAVAMKDAVRSRIPFGKVTEAFLGPDEGEAPAAEGTPFGGLRPEDVDAMQQAAMMMAQNVMGGRSPNAPARPPEAA